MLGETKDPTPARPHNLTLLASMKPFFIYSFPEASCGAVPRMQTEKGGDMSPWSLLDARRGFRKPQSICCPTGAWCFADISLGRCTPATRWGYYSEVEDIEVPESSGGLPHPWPD